MFVSIEIAARDFEANDKMGCPLKGSIEEWDSTES